MSEVSTNATERLYWMDFVRGVAILLVAIAHCATVMGMHGVEPSRFVLWFSSAVAPFRMPLLLFTSGFLLHRSLSKPLNVYINGKLRTLLWPWAVWSLVMYVVLLPEILEEQLSLSWFLSGTHTWYLTALFVVLLLALVLRKIPAIYVAAGYLVCSFIWNSTSFPDPTGLIGTVLWGGFFVYCGAAIAQRSMRFQLPGLVWTILFALACTAAFVSVKSAGHFSAPGLSALMSLAGVLVTADVAQRIPRIRIVRFFEWVGRNSIVGYVINWPLSLLLVEVFPESMNSNAIFLMLFTAVCIITILAIRFRERVDFLYVFPRLRQSASIWQTA